MKKWEILNKYQISYPPAGRAGFQFQMKDVINILLANRNIHTKRDIEAFLNPRIPYALTPKNVGIDQVQLHKAIVRIRKAVKNHESIVIYADYDADGITAGAILWETLHQLGAAVMPYIPHRVEEGYGLSHKGIDAVRESFNPKLIITVDHGITAKDKVAYANKLGIDVIVTDHHVKPKKLPTCLIIHTTQLSGAGVSWFVAKTLIGSGLGRKRPDPAHDELLSLAAIGTIADMVPLVGSNRSIVKYGLGAINQTKRVGIDALIHDAALMKGSIKTYEVSHMLAPRLNAMGRIEHALDALRLLCTKQKGKAELLAKKLGITNRERQQLTAETTAHALQGVPLRRQGDPFKKLIFVVHEEYNQGVIGLVAGKLVEEYYRPAIVVAKGEMISKASARSVAGFNIVEAIRSCSDILVDVGGHPMAAGFTIETQHLSALQERLEVIAEKELDEEKLTRTLRIDTEIPLECVSEKLWQRLKDLEPFGFGNPEPVFAARNVNVVDARTVGADGKHLKLRLQLTTHNSLQTTIEAIAFNFGSLKNTLKLGAVVDIAYAIGMDTWNGNKKLQLKIKDII